VQLINRPCVAWTVCYHITMYGIRIISFWLNKKPSYRWGTARARCQLKSGKILHKCSTDCTWKGLQQGNDLQGHSRSLTPVQFDRFVVVRGHPRSSAMPPFDRARTISYSSSIETGMRLSCTVFEIWRVICRKSPIFDLPHLHLAPPLGVTPFEFPKKFWHQKTSPWAIFRPAFRHFQY